MRQIADFLVHRIIQLNFTFERSCMKVICRHTHTHFLVSSKGVCYPGLQQLVAQWSPPSDRTKFSSLINAGAPVGTVTVLTMAGFLADRFGWESVFYVSGAMTIAWYVFWIFLVYDTPAVHPRITEEELILITGYSKKHHGLSSVDRVRQKIPWRSILTSVPVWVMIGAHTGQNWVRMYVIIIILWNKLLTRDFDICHERDRLTNWRTLPADNN